MPMRQPGSRLLRFRKGSTAFDEGDYKSRGNLGDIYLQLTRRDAIRERDLTAGGVGLFGASGSGKTSGLLSSLALACHKQHAGVIHSCVKPSDAARWRALAEMSGRHHMRSLTLEHDSFNPVQHAASRPGASVEDVLQVVMQPLRRRQQQGHGMEHFFVDENGRWLGYPITIALIAQQPLSFRWLSEVMACPRLLYQSLPV